jgi:hypothetical protein
MNKEAEAWFDSYVEAVVASNFRKAFQDELNGSTPEAWRAVLSTVEK